MSQKLQPVRGTKDLIFKEAEQFQFIRETALKVGRLYGFHPIETPIFEFTEVFKRTLGETSDVVNKEMYTFEDRGGESLTLRPEFTAGIARAFISNGWQQHLPLKLFTSGPVFRYERPQKGRQRQFHQIDFEYLGVEEPYADVEVILLGARILNELGILKKTKLHINSLGDKTSRRNYTEALVAYLKKYKGDLSEDSKIRLEKNPLRVLDSKNAGDREILKSAPTIRQHFTFEAAKFFEKVILSLSDSNRINDRVEFIVNPLLKVMENESIVRGLDYYNHTVFEFIADDDAGLGAQNTVLAGGRYDGLIEQMGGSSTPAVGFGAGMERLALIMSELHKNEKRPIAVAYIDDPKESSLGGYKRDPERVSHFIAELIRGKKNRAEIILVNSLKKAWEKAIKIGASHIVIIQRNEINAGIVKLAYLHGKYPEEEINFTNPQDLAEKLYEKIEIREQT